ncbi:MAG: hypothetical protein A3E78_02625, partial [Alphaproteobacteria bacterium RIFCSPHIGHO2_12_FULL_63_12]
TAAEQATRADRQIYLIATAEDGTEAPEPMTGDEFNRLSRSLQPEPLAPDYPRAAALATKLKGMVSNAEIVWLSDGVDHNGASALLSALQALGDVAIQLDSAAPTLALYPPDRNDANLIYKIRRASDAPWRGDVIASARDGRELGRASVEFTPGQAEATATIEMPLALQNDMALARIDGVTSAGAVQLVDARERRALIGMIAGGDESADPLLAGRHYVRKALAPYAQFITDSLENIIASDASVIVLDDIGVIRQGDVDALSAWVEKGGVLIRFAGPTLAQAAEEAAPPLLPVRLRGGGRAFGGALTWDTPQLLGGFSDSGPFAGMTPPTDVYVRRQVLAEPGGETSERSWASLADGTPLVTGQTLGAGAIALFHTTATPDWSDIPLSEIFVEMLRKLVFLSALGPESLNTDGARQVAPFRVLDGFGALKQPARDLAPSSTTDLAQGPAPGRPPGLYGAPEAPIALNAVSKDDAFNRARFEGADIRPYTVEPPVRIGPPLFLVALLLLLADGLVALRLAGKLAFIVLLFFLPAVAPRPASAAPLDRPLSPLAEEAALSMRLAFVRTGDPATDRVSEAGLRGLSAELTRRTSSEPAAPVGVDPETDDLSVYPFLYWPVTPGAAALSDRALANIESFMRFGGLIVFDTRDDERAVSGAETPEGIALKSILSGIDLPPLTPVAENHVLYRSFYLLSDLSGRMATRPVWVQSGDGPNDSVTPVIIGGRDWAGAWASNDAGEPLLPVRTTARPCTNAEGAIPRNPRECAYRAGINMVMVALTGNYKSDQVHTPVLLERLGRP